MTMGEKIKLHREQMHMTLEELGNKVGVGKSTVRKWENGMIANMRRDKISKIADALCISPAYLMGWTDDPDPNYDESSLHSPSIPDTMVDYVGNGFIVETNRSENDKFLNSLRDEEKEFIVRLYQDYLNADQSHRLAVEALLKEKRQES